MARIVQQRRRCTKEFAEIVSLIFHILSVVGAAETTRPSPVEAVNVVSGAIS
jgi:hypothetical protein